MTAYLDPAVGFVTTAQPADDPAGQVDLLADPAAAATYWRQSGPNVDVGRNPSGVPYPGGLRSLQYTATRRARLVFPGVTGNYCSVPNAANLQITGDIEVVVRCSLTDWTPVTIQTLVSRDGIPGGGAPAGSRSWSTRIHTTGQILFLMSADGTAGPTQVSSAVIPFTDGAMGWLKITRVATSGLVSFYSAPDSITEPTSWTARSTATINAGINLPAGNAAVGIGQRQTLEPLNGRIARAIVRNGIAGTTVLDVSENNAGTMTDATHFQATTGQTVTVTQTAGNTIVQPQPDSLVWRFDAADYPGTGLTYTDPRSRTWTLSVAGAIKGVTVTTPIPPGRGRWRLTWHTRAFSGNPAWSQTIVGELASARSRQLVQAWNTPAELRFTIDGHAPELADLTELANEVFAWRWDETAGKDICMFRGPIDHSQDTISEQAHTVNFVAHDLMATINRRFIIDGTPVTWTGYEQDRIIAALLSRAGAGPNPVLGFQPGSLLPMRATLVTPAGTGRAVTGTLRDRTYVGQKNIGEAIDELAHVQGGFDYDVVPEPQADDTLPSIDQTGLVNPLGPGRDALRIFWPTQGVARTDLVFNYGGNVSALSRTVNSADYANYVRSLGNNATSDPATPQLYGSASNPDASATTVGFWPYADNAPTDVSQQATLDQRAQGLVDTMGVLVPSYSLAMRPGAYRWGFPNMGDTVPLIIQSGRLSVNTTVRVVAITYDIGDDGDEDVQLVVGRPLSSLTDLLARTGTAVDALARR